MTHDKPATGRTAGRMWAARLVAGLGLILAMHVPPTAQAAPMAQAEVQVHRVLTRDVKDSAGNPALSVQVIYSLSDGASQDVEGSTLRLPDQPAPVQGIPDEPMDKDKWNIVLLTDLSRASGSDNGKDLLAARVALAGQLESGPESAFYAWYDFNEILLPQQSVFKSLDSKNPAKTDTDKKDSIPEKLAAPRSLPVKTVCLYQVLANAISLLQQPDITGKKAVLVLTHQDNTCPLATQAKLVTEMANTGDESNRVQIFAIGLGGPTLKAALDPLTRDTGGVAFVNDVTSIEPTVAQLLSAMKGQRQARFLTYPKQGPQTAKMTVQLNDGTAKLVDIPIAPQQDYALPPAISFVSAASQANGLMLIFNCSSPERLQRLRIELVSPATQQPIRIQDIPQVGGLSDGQGQCRSLIPRKEGETELEQKVPFELRVLVQLDSGELKSLAADGRPLTVQFDPTAPIINIVGASGPSVGSAKFVVTVTANLDQTRVDVMLVDVQAGEQAGGQIKSLVLSGDRPEAVEFEVGDLQNGTYVAQAVWSDGPGVPAIWPVRLAYQKETTLEAIRRGVGENEQSRLGAIGIGVAAVLLIIFLVWFIRSRGVSQIRAVRGEGLGEQHLRRIQVNVPNTSWQTSQGNGAPAGPPSNSAPVVAPAGTPAGTPKSAQNPTPTAAPLPAQPASQPMPQPASKPPASSAMNLPMATVRVRKPESVNFRGRIKKTPFTIGRDVGNDGVLPVDAKSGVSRQHISILFQDGRWYVRDEGTPNGTQVNGARIEPKQPVPLSNGAVLMLGSVEIEFQTQA